MAERHMESKFVYLCADEDDEVDEDESSLVVFFRNGEQTQRILEADYKRDHTALHRILSTAKPEQLAGLGGLRLSLDATAAADCGELRLSLDATADRDSDSWSDDSNSDSAREHGGEKQQHMAMSGSRRRRGAITTLFPASREETSAATLFCRRPDEDARIPFKQLCLWIARREVDGHVENEEQDMFTGRDMKQAAKVKAAEARPKEALRNMKRLIKRDELARAQKEAAKRRQEAERVEESKRQRVEAARAVKEATVKQEKQAAARVKAKAKAKAKADREAHLERIRADPA